MMYSVDQGITRITVVEELQRQGWLPQMKFSELTPELIATLDEMENESYAFSLSEAVNRVYYRFIKNNGVTIEEFHDNRRDDDLV